MQHFPSPFLVKKQKNLLPFTEHNLDYRTPARPTCTVVLTDELVPRRHFERHGLGAAKKGLHLLQGSKLIEFHDSIHPPMKNRNERLVQTYFHWKPTALFRITLHWTIFIHRSM